jgi:hypothetical protein
MDRHSIAADRRRFPVEPKEQHDCASPTSTAIEVIPGKNQDRLEEVVCFHSALHRVVKIVTKVTVISLDVVIRQCYV